MVTDSSHVRMYVAEGNLDHKDSWESDMVNRRLLVHISCCSAFNSASCHFKMTTDSNHGKIWPLTRPSVNIPQSKVIGVQTRLCPTRLPAVTLLNMPLHTNG